MKILCTGGAGYLGSIMVHELLRHGLDVTVIDSFMYRQNSLAACCADDSFHLVRGDVRDMHTMRPLIAKADVIIPLAAFVGAPLCARDPVGATSTNHDAITAMLKHVSLSQWILMPTTNSAYGTGDENHECTEDSPLRPQSLYAREKVAVERELMEHANAISLRLATVFGASPRMRIDLLVNSFVYKAHIDRAITLFESGFKRNYIHVRDVAWAFLHGIDHFEAMRGQVYNVGLSDANLSKLELCQAIARHVPGFVYLDAPVGKDPDQRNYLVSNQKIEATGFRPTYSLDAGIRELLKLYSSLSNERYGNV